MPKKVFQIGERVKIVNPFIFIRCGYDKHFKTDVEKWEHWLTCNRKILDQITEATGVRICKTQLSRVLSYSEISAAKNKPGAERKIYTTENKFLKDVYGIVMNKYVVRTGIYYPPSGYHEYYEYYEPGGLEKANSHVILTVSIPHLLKSIEIEECHVLSLDSEYPPCGA